jgi:putative FmdB family regulatory protein
MPFYEYECQACKYYTEVMQKISEAPLTKCPSCGKRALKKLVSAPVFRLKGAGWYETDFKSDQEKKRNLVGNEKEEPKAEAKSDTAAAKDSKPESKEAKPGKEKSDSKAPETKPTPARRSTGSAAKNVRRAARVPARAARKRRR